jgi:fructokinase
VKDILVIGEALVDIVVAPGRPPVEHAGGSPANVALGLARLGHSTSLLTRIGSDARGDMIRAHLAASGVQVVDGSVTPGPTSTATAVLDERGIATYDFNLDWSLPPDAGIGTVDAVHTGSIAATLAPGGDDVVRLIETAAGRAVVTYDPNARPALMGTPAQALERIERLIRVSDVVKVSDEDLEWLLPGQDPIEIATSWRQQGPAMVVVTKGGSGATGVLAAGRVDVAAPPITVVDTVGAGDAFTSGLLDGLASADLLSVDRIPTLRASRPDDLAAILRHAVTVAAVTCTRAGANPPTPSELADWVAGVGS